MTLATVCVVLALICAFLGAGDLKFGATADGKPRFTPNWIALALAFWFASMLVRR